MAEYPLSKFHFQVQWGGSKLSFTEVTGLDRQVEVIEYRAGDFRESSKDKMPGLTKNSNITLKRGTFKGDNEFYQWLNSVQFNQIERRDLTISMLNENHEPIVTFKVRNAWATKIQYADLKADGNEVAIETLEVAHEGLVVQND